MEGTVFAADHHLIACKLRIKELPTVKYILALITYTYLCEICPYDSLTVLYDMLKGL